MVCKRGRGSISKGSAKLVFVKFLLYELPSVFVLMRIPLLKFQTQTN